MEITIRTWIEFNAHRFVYLDYGLTAVDETESAQ